MEYKEVELYGRKIRYFSEEHIEMERRMVKNNWKKIAITPDHEYKSISIISCGNTNKTSLHRFIFFIHNPSWNIYDGSKDNYIDHFDGDPSNNNIANLRCVTQQENNWNRVNAKGCYLRETGKWCAQIKVDGKIIRLGQFDNEEDARNAYLEAKKKYHIIKEKVF